MKKTICLFAAHFYPHLGGIERYNHQLAVKLVGMGYQVVIVTSNTDNCDPVEIIDGINVIRLPVINFMNGRLPFPKVNASFFKLIKSVKNFKSDFYIINARFYIHSLLGALLAKITQKPSFLIEHGTGHFSVNNRILDSIGHLYEHILTFGLKKLVKNFYGVSLACNRWLEHFNIKAKGVFYNGIDSRYSIKKATDYKKSFNLPEDSIIISFVGRLIPEKGILELIGAFELLQRNYPNIFLFIAGDGPLFNEITSRVNKQKTKLLGKITMDQVMDLLNNSDIFVLPTNFPEGLPTSVLEAGLNECAVIATPKGGTPEVIINQHMGELISTNAMEEIACAIEKLLNDPDLLNLMKINLKRRVTEDFDWSIIAMNVVNELEQTR